MWRLCALFHKKKWCTKSLWTVSHYLATLQVRFNLNSISKINHFLEMKSCSAWSCQYWQFVFLSFFSLSFFLFKISSVWFNDWGNVMKAKHHNRNWHLQNSGVNHKTETDPSRCSYNWNQEENNMKWYLRNKH